MGRNSTWKTIRKKLVSAITTIVLTFGFFSMLTFALAADCETYLDETTCITDVACEWDGSLCSEIPEDLTLENPAEMQILEMEEVDLADGWEPSMLQTYGTKFLIRAKEALSWSLNIEDAGLESEAIKTSYNKVLTIVNSLFILGLLAIAAMWMFSILIPRRYLKQVILVYAAAVIFVNFAMPLNKLFIDTTNLLQKTLLVEDGGTIAITDIVEAPLYEEIIGYQLDTDAIQVDQEMEVGIVTEDPVETEVVVGNVLSEDPLTGTMTDGTDTYDLELNAPESNISLGANQSFTISKADTFNPNSEQSIFAFIMILATGLAYFVLALIFVLRVVILWALLILSPVLFLLAIFRITRGWFWNWLSIYGKWLLIGPLAALGIAIIVNIWKTVGIPIESSYTDGTFPSVSNIYFYLPGSSEPNTLSSTSEMMEYMVFLMMLYLPIFFAFVLTRQKFIGAMATTIVEKVSRPKLATRVQTEKSETRNEEKTKNPGITEGVKDFVSSKISKLTETAMPGSLTNITARSGSVIPSASSFLPENLTLTSLHGMLELVGMQKESRNSRGEAIGKLANPSNLKDTKEKRNVSAIRNEIDKRASAGDPEAAILMNEIRSKESGKESETIKTTTRENTNLSGGTEAAGTRPTTASETHTTTKVEVEPLTSVETGTTKEIHEVKETKEEKETVIVEKGKEVEKEELKENVEPEDEEKEEIEKQEEEIIEDELDNQVKE